MGDNTEGNPNVNVEQPRAENVDYTRSLRDLFAPVATNSASCIVLPPTNATHFDLKPHVITLLPSFHGLDLENPYSHVKKFKDICATFKFQNFSEEFVHLRLFPFSLHDRAKAWLDSNMPGSITSWDNLLNKFYNKFFPMSKWDFSSYRDRSARIQKKGGIYEVKEDVELKMKLDALTKKVDALVVGKSINAANPFHVDCCSICASPIHSAQTCPSLPTFVESSLEQVNAFNDFRKQSNGPFSETYNPGWRNHPNFSWKQNQPMNQGGSPHQAHNQYPPGFHQSVQGRQVLPAPAYHVPTQSPASSSHSTLEDSLKAFIQFSNQTISEVKNATLVNTQSINEVKNATMVNSQAIAKMEVQLGQMANQLGEREKGKLPSQPVPNPRLQFQGGGSSNAVQGQEHVQAIVSLRSGRQVDNQVGLSEENLVVEQERRSGGTKEKDVEPSTAIDETPPRSFIPKFLKDLITVKRKTNVPKKVCLTEHVSSILQCKLPIKHKDPGCPTISCMIGVSRIEKALLDLGASVNLLPYSVYLQLGLGELKPTSMTLQLADRSVKVPRGIIEDVLIKDKGHEDLFWQHDSGAEHLRHQQIAIRDY
ncbi:uncharacterized protein LOC133869023 [Alnus glutinosa]|uniref:uncharacterized protein LOC133869023 n=1 Tax=Alnus glutinosa TaxID=3517 RepID=UPI002D79276D|nr:uncharacterized protein LOC133869023 [Alnus glutinosa]